MARLLSELPPPDVAQPPLPAPHTTDQHPSRRRFLKTALGALAAGGAGTAWIGLREAHDCRVLPVDAPLPHLPAAFAGLRVAFMADTHHSANVSLSYLERVVAMTNALLPDLILLGGDYVLRRWDNDHPSSLPYVRPGIGVFGGLRAPLGVFAVLGNHDG